MGVAGVGELVGGGFELDGKGRFRDELGGVGADDMDAEDAAGLRFGDDFHKSFVVI